MLVKENLKLKERVSNYFNSLEYRLTYINDEMTLSQLELYIRNMTDLGYIVKRVFDKKRYSYRMSNICKTLEGINPSFFYSFIIVSTMFL